MPRVKGPLFSATAKGTLADTLTYQKGHGGPRVGKMPLHRDMQSAGQLAQRRRFSEAKWLWRGMEAATKADYEALGAAEGMTGWNYWLRVFLSGELYADAGLYLPMHEGDGNVVHDFSAYGDNGSIVGGVWKRVESGPPFLLLDGSDDYVYVGGDTSQLNYTTEDFSFIIRAYALSLPPLYFLMARGLHSVDGYTMYGMADGRLFMRTCLSGGNVYSISSVGDMVAGQWLTLGFTRQGTSVRLYKNGVDITLFPGNHPDPDSCDRDVTIGIYGNKVTSPFHGYLASPIWIQRKLTTAEMLAWHKILACEG